jgi:hypothetical protein
MTGDGAATLEQPPRKKGLSGCAIAALIVGGIALFGLIAVVAGGLWFFNRSEVGVALRDTILDARNAESAPGTDQMRAAGCTFASAFDLSRMVRLGQSRVRDPEEREQLDRMVGAFNVSCASTTLTCEQVAAAWGQGAPPGARSAMVTVFGPGENRRPRCSGRFDRSGVPIPDGAGPAEAMPESDVQ